MARTPKPPKLKQGGLNGLQKMVLAGFAGSVGVMFFLPLAIVTFLDIPNLRMGADDLSNLWAITKFCAVLFVLVSPFFWRLVARFVAWGFDDLRPSRWKDSELAQTVRDYKERETIPFDRHLRLQTNVQGMMHLGVVVLTMIALLYFSFWPWRDVVAGWVDQRWVGILLLFSPYVVALFLLMSDTVSYRFADLAFSVIGGEHHYNKKAAPVSDLTAPPPTPEEIDRMMFGDPPAPTDDDFSFDANTFGKNDSAAKDQKAANPKSSFGGEAEAPKKEGKASEHHPDDLALWAVVSDPESTAEERKTALDMILEREAKRNPKE